MKTLLHIFCVLLLAFASVSCSGDCTHCRFPPGATMEYSYTNENGQIVAAQATANDGGCIAIPCNADGSSIEILVN